MPTSFDPKAFLAPLPGPDSGAVPFDPEAFLATEVAPEPTLLQQFGAGAAHVLPQGEAPKGSFTDRLVGGAVRDLAALPSIMPGSLRPFATATDAAADAVSNDPDSPLLSYADDTLRSGASQWARTGESIGFMLEKYGGPLATTLAGPGLDAMRLLGVVPDGITAKGGAQVAGRALRDVSRASADTWMEGVSEGYKAQAGAQLGDEGFGATTLISALVGSLPEMALTMGAGGAGGKLAQGAMEGWLARTASEAAAGGARAQRVMKFGKYAPAAAGATAGGMAEGFMAAGASGAAVEEQILGMGHDDLITGSERYLAIYTAAEGMDETKRQQYAKATLADEAGRATALQVGLFTTAAGAPTGALAGHLAGRGVAKAGAQRAATWLESKASGQALVGGTAEFLQEAVQEGGQQYMENAGIREYADRSQDRWEGVATSMIIGGLVGGIVGGTLTPLVGSESRQQAKLQLKADAAKDGSIDPGATPTARSPILEAHITDLMQQAQAAGVPDAEFTKVTRWAGLNGGRSALELRAALEELVETGAAPEHVNAVVGEDFDATGLLTEAALAKDAERFDMSARLTLRPTPEQLLPLAEKLAALNITPYLMDDGALVVPQSRDGADGLNVVAEQLVRATGVAVTVTTGDPDETAASAQDQPTESPAPAGAEVADAAATEGPLTESKPAKIDTDPGQIGLASTLVATPPKAEAGPGFVKPTHPARAALQNRVDNDFNALVNEYNALPDSKGGVILSGDTSKELSPEFLTDRAGMSGPVHPAASGFIWKLYNKRLSEPTPAGRAPAVLILGGGTGAGKSSGLSRLSGGPTSHEIIYDSNTAEFEGAVERIDLARKAGREVQMVYTYRDILEAFRDGVIKRAKAQEAEFGSGRVITIDTHVNTHTGSAEVYRKLVAHYAGDPEVEVIGVDNSRGRDNAAIVDVDAMPKVGKIEAIKEALHEELETQYRAGDISRAIYEGISGRKAADLQGAVEAGRAGVRGQSEQVGAGGARARGEGPQVTARGAVVITPEAGTFALDAAGRNAASHPESDHRDPTDRELVAGNYPKGHGILRGPEPGQDIPVSIENVPGSIRRAVGGGWSRKMVHHYGYIKGTLSSDGDAVDIYLGRQSHDNTLPVFVVHQMDPKTGAFDEPKVVMGYATEGEAKTAYLSEYPRHLHTGLFGGITRLTRAQFADWLATRQTDVPPHPLSKQPMLSLRPATGERAGRITAPRTAFEIAPHPKALIAAAWNALPLAERVAASHDALQALVPLLQEAGLPVTAFDDSVGGYGDDVNPSHGMTLSPLSSHADRLTAAAAIGQALQQESVILVEPQSDNEVGAVTIDFHDGLTPDSAQHVYTHLRDTIGEAIGGFSVNGDTMEILNFSDVDTVDLAGKVRDAIDTIEGSFDVYSERIGATFVEENDYDRHLQGLPQARLRAIRAARSAHQKAIEQAVARHQKAAGKKPALSLRKAPALSLAPKGKTVNDPASPPRLHIMPGLFSALYEALQTTPGTPKATTADKWVQWLDGAQRRGLFRKEEREWTDIDAALVKRASYLAAAGVPQKIPLEILLNAVRESYPAITEVALGSVSEDELDAARRQMADEHMEGFDFDGWGWGEVEPVWLLEGDEYDSREAAEADLARALENDPEFEESIEERWKVSLYGETMDEEPRTFDTGAAAEAYRDSSIKDAEERASDNERNWYMGATGDDEVRDWMRVNGDPAGESSLYEEYTAPGGTHYRELLFQLEDFDYDSSHFNDRGEGLLMHARVKDRQLPEVGRVLSIEELQSDAAQDARSEGAVSKAEAAAIHARNSAAHAAAVASREAAKSEMKALLEGSTDNPRWIMLQLNDIANDTQARDVFVAELTDEGRPIVERHWDRLTALAAQWKAGEDAATEIVANGEAPPVAPLFHGSWQEVLLKGMLQRAAQQGYDAVTWTTGFQQAERYRGATSRAVDRIVWVPTDPVQRERLRTAKAVPVRGEDRVSTRYGLQLVPYSGVYWFTDAAGTKIAPLQASHQTYELAQRYLSTPGGVMTPEQWVRGRAALAEIRAERAQHERVTEPQWFLDAGIPGQPRLGPYPTAEAAEAGAGAVYAQRLAEQAAFADRHAGILVGRLQNDEKFRYPIDREFVTRDLINGERRSLRELVGAEIAEAVRAAPESDASFNSRQVVGGKGMVLQYDRMMPKIAEKLVKPLGGTVEKAAAFPRTTPGGAEGWVVRITPAMRELLAGDLPAYSLTPAPAGSEARPGLFAEFPLAQQHAVAAGGPVYYRAPGSPVLSRDPAAVDGATLEPVTLTLANPHAMTEAELVALQALPTMVQAARLHALAEQGHDGIATPTRARPLTPDAVTPLDPRAPALTLADLRRGQDRRAEVAAVLDKVAAGWRGRPAIRVTADERGVPDHARAHIEAMGVQGRAEGFFDPVTGAVWLLANNIHRREGESLHDAVERVVSEEVLGHHGLRATFGEPALNALFDQVWADHQTSPAMQAIIDDYAAAYGDPFTDKAAARQMADEFLAKHDPAAEPGLWDMLVGWLREQLRAIGMVRHWSDNDLRNLMERVFDGVRTGMTPSGSEKLAQTLVGVQGLTTTATVRDGNGQRVTTYRGDTRTVEAPGFRASMVDGWEQDGPALELTEFVGDLSALADHAALEGKRFIVAPAGMIAPEAARRAGLPLAQDGGATVVTLPVERPVPARAPSFALNNRAKGNAKVEEILARTLAPNPSDLSYGQRLQQFARELTGYYGDTDTWLELKAGWVDSAAAIERLERDQFGGNLLDAAESAYKFISLTKNGPQVMAAVMKHGVPGYRDGVFVREPGRKGLAEIYAPLYTGGQNLGYLYEGYAVARRSAQLIQQTNRDGSSKEKLLSQNDIDTLLALEQDHPIFAKVFAEWQTFNRQLLQLAVDRGAMSQETADLWAQNDYVPFYRTQEEEDVAAGMARKRGFSGQRVTSKRLTGSDKRIQPVLQNTVMNTAAILHTVYHNEAMNRIVALADKVALEKVPMRMEAIKVSNADIARAMVKAGLFVGDDSNTTATQRRAGRLLHDNNIDYAVRAVEAMTPEQRAQWTTLFHPTKPVGNDIVSVTVAGKPVYYRVHDPLVLRAIMDMTPTTYGGIINLMGGAKHLLTNMVTADPGFILANYLRDAASSWVTVNEDGPLGFNPLAGALRNAVDIYGEQGLVSDLAMAGGMTGGYYDTNVDLGKSLRAVHHTTVLDSPRKLWEGYRKLGQVSEQVNRMAVARAVLARGGSLAEAAYQAQDVLNFTQSGDAVAAQILMRTVPFLNARIQGLYRLYKGARGLDQKDRDKAMLAFFTKFLMLGALSMLLALKNRGDERYEKLPDDQKDTYWHIFVGDQHYAIPKPFEVGVLAATIPERLVRRLTGDDNNKTLLDSIERALGDTLAFNPIPQLFKPMVEQWANKAFFTGSPIVGMELEGLLPVAQYNPWTSETARGVATVVDQVVPDVFQKLPGVATLHSPVRLEHAVRAYFGTVGSYALQLSDAALRATGVAPEAPAWGSVRDVPVIGRVAGRFVRGEPELQGRSKYSDDLYDALKDADAAYRTMNAYLRQGEIAKVEQLVGQRQTELSVREALHAFKTRASDLNTLQRQVMMSDMGPEEKRELLDEITRSKNVLMRESAPYLALLDE